MAESEDNTSRVKGQMLAGVRWVAGARVVSESLSVVSTIVLARLIAPPEFGRAVVALMIATVASVLASHAFASLLIQKNEIDDDEVRSAVALNVTIGLCLSLLVFALAGPLSALTSGDQAGLIRAVSPVCLLAGINAVPAAMLQRRLDFRRLSMMSVGSLLTQVVVSVGLAALAGAGASAIVAGALAAQVVSTAIAFSAAPPPRPRVRLDAVRRLTSFGGPTALSNLVFTGFQNVDYAIVGARLNPAALAFYYRAFQYGVDYQAKISRILVDMAFPVYSRLGALDEVRRVRARIVRVHAAVIFPLLAGYAALAPTFVPWLLGARWEPVVVPSQYLAVAGAVTAVLTGTGALMLAMGRPRLVLGWNLGHLLVYGVVVYVAAPHGIVVVAAAVAAYYIVQGLATHWFLLRRVVGVPMRDLGKELAGPGCGCAALLLCAALLRRVLADAGLPPAIVLVVAGATGLIAYVLCIRYLFPGIWADLMLLVRRLLQRATPAASPSEPNEPSEPGEPSEPSEPAANVRAA
jgi:O-antigen/teichoic acid export membrane protein